MPTPKKGARLGGSAAHQKLILANLATSLFEHGRITTTEAKARVLRPHAEKLITKAKKGDLHNRRQVLATIKDKGVVHALFEEIAPRYAERPGGYTRITKIGPRKGDNAPMAVIELVTEEYTAKPASGTGSTRRPARGARRGGPGRGDHRRGHHPRRLRSRTTAPRLRPTRRPRRPRLPPSRCRSSTPSRTPDESTGSPVHEGRRVAPSRFIARARHPLGDGGPCCVSRRVNRRQHGLTRCSAST